MDVGIKIFPDRLKKAQKLAKISDFIELMITPGLQPVKDLKKGDARFTAHAPHSRYDFNPADSRLESYNLKLINHTLRIADSIRAGFIVIHAGRISNNHCSVENALKFLKKIDDPRIIIENQCHAGALNRTPEKLKGFVQELGCGICFDFSHATVNAYYHKIPYKRFIRRFIRLKPGYFHVCDGYYNPVDNHKNLGTGSLDLDFFRKCIGSKPAVLEVEPDASVESLKTQVSLLKDGA